LPRSPWHITRTDDALTLSRRLPARFDLAVETTLPGGDPVRLAHQIRQDMWRALQSLRGFAPAVEISAAGEGLRVRAGGQVAGQVPGNAAGRIAEVLDSPANRARWLRHAGFRPDTNRSESGATVKNAHKFAAEIDKTDESAP